MFDVAPSVGEAVVTFYLKPDGKPKAWLDGCEVFPDREYTGPIKIGQKTRCELKRSPNRDNVLFAYPIAAVGNPNEETVPATISEPVAEQPPCEGPISNEPETVVHTVERISRNEISSDLMVWRRCRALISADGKTLVLRPDAIGNIEVSNGTVCLPGLTRYSPFSGRERLEFKDIEGGGIMIALC